HPGVPGAAVRREDDKGQARDDEGSEAGLLDPARAAEGHRLAEARTAPRGLRRLRLRPEQAGKRADDEQRGPGRDHADHGRRGLLHGRAAEAVVQEAPTPGWGLGRWLLPNTDQWPELETVRTIASSIGFDRHEHIPRSRMENSAHV